MRYIVHLDLSVEAKDIGEAAGWTQKHITECFRPGGFAVIGGTIDRAREDKPVETVVLGSSEAYVNMAAEADLSGLEVVPTTLEDLGLRMPMGNAGTRSGATA